MTKLWEGRERRASLHCHELLKEHSAHLLHEAAQKNGAEGATNFQVGTKRNLF